MIKPLALEVARELNINPEKAYEICKSFHDGMRELLRNPEDCKAGIMIENFLSMKLKSMKLENSLSIPQARDKELRKIVINNLKKYERKKYETIKKRQAES